MRRMHVRQLARRTMSILSIVCASAAIAAAIAWPKGYVVYEQTTSPNDKYGIIVLGREAIDNGDIPEKNPVYLVDVPAHRVLAAIRGVDYFEGANHRGLSALWNDDSSACVVTGDDRYGFDTITFVEVKGDALKQTDLGKRIEAALKRLFDGYINAFFRFKPGGKLAVRALSYTNPKQLDDVKSEFGAFEGTFDVASGKWSGINARRMKEPEWNTLESALGYERDVNIDNASAEDLESMLNEAYGALRLTMPAPRFAKLKQEQIAWLKQRDAAAAPEKTRLTRERVTALLDALW